MIELSDNARESDLAYLKRLVLAGRGAPAPFLLLMAIFGGGYGLTFIFLFAAITVDGARTAGLLFQTFRWLFVATSFVVVIALIWTSWRLFQSNSPRLNRAAAATWTASFIGMLASTASILILARHQVPSDHVYAIYLEGPILLALWGCAWWVTAIASERRWLLTFGIGSFLTALLAAWIGNAPTLPLVAGLSLLLLAGLPAVLLMREKRT